MTVRKTLHIKSWTRFFRWNMLKFRSPNLYTIIKVAIIKKGFLKKKERVKDFFIFISMLSFKQVESNNKNKEPCKQGCSWIIGFLIVSISDTVNMVLPFFQFELKMAVHSPFTKKRIYEVNNFWYFFKKS